MMPAPVVAVVVVVVPVTVMSVSVMRVRGVVETARELAADEVTALEAKTSAALGQKVSLEPRVADELIGGVRIRVGNTLYDGSVATALEDLERRLKEAPLP